MISLYAATIQPVMMPWWGWVTQIVWTGAVCRLAYDKHLEYKEQLYNRHLSHIVAMTIKHIGACGCHPWERCKIHGDIEFRINAEPEVREILEAADVLATAKFAAKLEEKTEADLLKEHREKEAQKRRLREAAAEDAKAEAETREKRRQENRDRLAREAETKRERTRLKRAAEEADRAEANGNKHKTWMTHKDAILDAVGLRRGSSSPPDEGGG